MYYLLGLPENVFFYFIVFHFILLSLNLGIGLRLVWFGRVLRGAV